MSNINECRKLMRGIIGEPNQDSHICIITAVDGVTCDVKRIIDGKEIKRVRLNATIKASDGLVIVPKTCSAVLVTKIDSNKYFVSQFSEIEKIILNVTDHVEVNAANTITFNSGENGGLVLSEKVADKISALETEINNLKNVFSSWVTVPNDGGAALKLAVTTWASGTISPLSEKTFFENTKITH
ncbi:MAG: hypothetical protein LBR52_04725 [Prevotellaceae bacterium]|jgi:hypothetical protein|nr:hypothetical protein [Prevotellaceae bacterium]